VKRFLVCILFAGASILTAQVSIGIQIGAPPPPRIVRVRPIAPGPDYLWVDGYWYVVGNRYRWHVGYWTSPPYAGYRWVVPRYEGERYYGGYWDGEAHGRVEHDHHWDRDRYRDYREHRDRR
jgi:hypothetical protein